MAENDDPLRDAGHIVHIVADDDNGGPGLFPVGADVVQYLAASGRVQAGGGLVQNQHPGAHGNDAGDGYAALLPAGQLQGGLFKQFFLHAHKAGCLPHPLVDLLLGELHVLRPEGDVLIHRLLKELILRVLEHQAHLVLHIPAAELALIDVLPAAADLAGAGGKQGVHMLNKGGLAGACMADDAHQLALGNGKVNILNGRHFKRSARAVNMAQLLHNYFCHLLSSEFFHDLFGAGIHVQRRQGQVHAPLLQVIQKPGGLRHGEALPLHQVDIGKDLRRQPVGNDAAV